MKTEEQYINEIKARIDRCKTPYIKNIESGYLIWRESPTEKQKLHFQKLRKKIDKATLKIEKRNLKIEEAERKKNNQIIEKLLKQNKPI